jgi:hypothetical protein
MSPTSSRSAPCSPGTAVSTSPSPKSSAPGPFRAENDPHAAAVLAARFPGVPNLGDVTTVDRAAAPRVDVVTARTSRSRAAVAVWRPELAPACGPLWWPPSPSSGRGWWW